MCFGMLGPIESLASCGATLGGRLLVVMKTAQGSKVRMGVVVRAKVAVIHVGRSCPTPLTRVLSHMGTGIVVTAEHIRPYHFPGLRERGCAP